jgi:hypothetical protein
VIKLDRKIITTLQFKEAVTVTHIDYDGITFNNGLKIEHFHDQTCCEEVYADWEALQTTAFVIEEFNEIIISGIPDGGIGLNEYFVPCYQKSNGYYSNNLSVQIKIDGTIIDFDISDYEKQEIW